MAEPASAAPIPGPSTGSRASGRRRRTTGSRQAASAIRATPRRSGVRDHGVGHVRLAAGRKLDLAVLGAHGRRPVGEAVDEDAVAKRHPAQPDGRRAHPASPIVRATCRKQRTASSRSSIAARSSAEWTSDPGEERIHPHRHEAVGDRAERLAHVVAVGEAGVDHRRERRPGLDLAARTPRSRDRAACPRGESVPPTFSTNSNSKLDPGQRGSRRPPRSRPCVISGKDPAVAHEPRARRG